MFKNDEMNMEVTQQLISTGAIQLEQPKTNVLSMVKELSMIPAVTNEKFMSKMEVMTFNDMSDLSKLTVHFDNLVNTFGIDTVKAAIFLNFKMSEKPQEETQPDVQ